MAESSMSSPRRQVIRIWRLNEDVVQCIFPDRTDLRLETRMGSDSLFAKAVDSAIHYSPGAEESGRYPHRGLLASEAPDKILIAPVGESMPPRGFLEVHGAHASSYSDLEGIAELIQPFAAEIIRIRNELGLAHRERETLVRASDDVQMAQLAFMSVHDLAGLYHNLQEPLKMLLSVVRHGHSLERRARDEMVNTVADALVALHEQFAHLARLGRRGRDDNDRTNRLHLAGAARSAIDLYTEQAKRFRVEVVFKSAGDPVLKGVSRSQVDRVIYNLLSNAIHWSAQQSHGRVDVEVGANSVGPFVRVEDNGPGVDPEYVGRIFEPGFSMKRDGTGLGLASVQRSVVAMGATSQVRTAFGRGFMIEVQWTA